MRGLLLRELGEPENLSLEELDDPKPGPGEVLVALRTAALNFPDLLTVRGLYQARPPLPFVPGMEGAGTVLEVGSQTTKLSPGDPVIVQVDHGTFAELATVPEQNCFKMPEGLAFDQATAMGIAFQTAYFALKDRAQVEPGDVVLVTGATGSVGIAAMQLARHWGCSVIAGLTTPSKENIARENGAHEVIDISGTDVQDSIRRQVQALTAGRGVDVVLEIVGGDVFAGALRSLAFRGRMVVVGFTSGEIPELRTNYVLLKNIAVTGIDRAQYLSRDPEWMHRAQGEIFSLRMAGIIKMPVQASFPLESFVEAFDVLRRRDIRGKVVLSIAN